MKSTGNQNSRILVIDDNVAIHEDFRKSLGGVARNDRMAMMKRSLFGAKTEGTRPEYHIDSAQQGEEGFEKVRAARQQGTPYAMAFVDMRMPPGWDGLETIRRLFEVDQEIQVVMCTAHADYSWEQIHKQLGHTDRVLVLKKPFDTIEVNQLASSLAERWSLRRQVNIKMAELESMVHERTRELHAQSMRDPLTGLPNRAYLNEMLPQLLARGEAAGHSAMYFLDFDRFKLINDSLGHKIGDEMLTHITARLQRVLEARGHTRPEAGRDFAARLGGDEFVIVLEKIDSMEEAEKFASALLVTLAEPFNLAGHDLQVTASIGLTTTHQGYRYAEDMLRDADTAMYRAKHSGRGRWARFDRGMHDEALRRLVLENDLRRAIEREELRLMYQPIVSMVGGVLKGFEALVRWHHPERGVINPAEFIGIAEETGLILPLGRWVLRRACAQLREWRNKHGFAEHISMSVNLSRRQFADPSLTDTVAEALQTHGIPADHLCLEITESAIMEDGESSVAILQRLRDSGVHLHMDDFGTGFSSLNCLHSMPMNCLKIDRSFIKTMLHRRDYAAVVNAIIQLAHNLGMAVVAEGVETQEQAALLLALECDFVQGYLFARPLNDADALATIVAAQRGEASWMRGASGHAVNRG